MQTKDIEMLQEIDFSQFSKVKESLRQQLLANREYELSMDELDMVTAAGTTHLPEKKTKNNL